MKIVKSIRMSLPPIDRGFWTDEELMEELAFGSIAPLKKGSASGVAKAVKYKDVTGKYKRLWDRFAHQKMKFMANLAKHAGLSIDDALAITGAITDEWFIKADEMIITDRQTAFISSAYHRPATTIVIARKIDGEWQAEPQPHLRLNAADYRLLRNYVSEFRIGMTEYARDEQIDEVTEERIIPPTPDYYQFVERSA